MSRRPVVDEEKFERGATSALRQKKRTYRVEHVNGPWLLLQDEKNCCPFSNPAGQYNEMNKAKG